ncbi:ParB/RepB/Spo0J family partition protein [Gemmobacter lanyuensis]
MEELKSSIRASGQRLPVEVVALPEGRFGLISGWRRIAALKELAEEAGETAPEVLALVREGREAGAIYAGMVEENELRAALTPYERGRIAAVAAGQGPLLRSMQQSMQSLPRLQNPNGRRSADLPSCMRCWAICWPIRRRWGKAGPRIGAGLARWAGGSAAYGAGRG